jgi:hypothetical protein
VNKKLEEVVRLLREKTEAGRVNWSEVIEDVFRTNVAGSLFRIGRTHRQMEIDERGWRDVPFIDITISNPFGKVVEEESFMEDEPGYLLAEPLFKAARRSAHGADQTLETMLNVISGPNF